MPGMRTSTSTTSNGRALEHVERHKSVLGRLGDDPALAEHAREGGAQHVLVVDDQRTDGLVAFVAKRTARLLGVIGAVGTDGQLGSPRRVARERPLRIEPLRSELHAVRREAVRAVTVPDGLEKLPEASRSSRVELRDSSFAQSHGLRNGLARHSLEVAHANDLALALGETLDCVVQGDARALLDGDVERARGRPRRDPPSTPRAGRRSRPPRHAAPGRGSSTAGRSTSRSTRRRYP